MRGVKQRNKERSGKAEQGCEVESEEKQEGGAEL
jgi:hypothetical protein